MALTAYLRLHAATQGEIRGSVTQTGREGCMAVLESNHEVLAMADGATGRPNGQRQHRPFVVVKEIDQATPALYRALVAGELFTEVEIQYWARRAGKAGKAGAAGSEVHRYTVRLSQAVMMGMRFVQPDVLDPAMQAFPEAEELSFAYERIEWLWVSPPSAASDDTLAATGQPRQPQPQRVPRQRRVAKPPAKA